MRNFFNAIDPSFAGFIAVCIVGAVIGFGVGIFTSEALTHDMFQQAQIEKSCIDGNDRACRLYEVKYGR